jgi:hypothetical protein
VVKVYAVSLTLGVFGLVAWIFSVYVGSEREHLDPDRRFGLTGRRVVAALVGLGIAGLSAEFSPRDFSWPVSLILALVGATVAAWYAGWAARHEPPESHPTET